MSAHDAREASFHEDADGDPYDGDDDGCPGESEDVDPCPGCGEPWDHEPDCPVAADLLREMMEAEAERRPDQGPVKP